MELLELNGGVDDYFGVSVAITVPTISQWRGGVRIFAPLKMEALITFTL